MPSGMKRVFITPLDAVETTDKEDVGTLRFEGNKIYKWVKLYNDTATVAGVDGDFVAYAAVTGAEDSTVVLDRDDADTLVIGAGMLIGTVAGVVDTAYYLWIQIKGPATLSTTLGGTTADGSTLMAGSTDKAVTLFTNDDTTEANDGFPIAVANDESAKKVILDCPF